MSEARQWICEVCGYVHTGPEPPEVCPVCGAPASAFHPAPEPEASPAEAAAAPRGGRIVIAGGGAAGVEAAQAARETDPEAAITLLAKEEELPYFRLNLTRYLAGEVEAADLPMHPASWYDAHRIELLLGCEAAAIDRAARTVRALDGRTFPYDRLVLACGADPFLPPVPGRERRGVFTVRERRDADAILERASRARRAVIIGGGILGIETAAALGRRGLAATIIENGDRLLRRQLDQEAARLLGDHLAAAGLAFRTGRTAERIEGGERAEAVVLSDGERLPADIVLFSTGIRGNVGLARDAGLAEGPWIDVDASLRTADPAILAAGDGTRADGRAYGIWPASVLEGQVAGRNAAGRNVRFGPLAPSNTVKVIGVAIFSVGAILPADPRDLEIRESSDGAYRKLLIRDGRLAGGVFVGDTTAGPAVKDAIEAGAPVPEGIDRGAPVGAVLDAIGAR